MIKRILSTLVVLCVSLQLFAQYFSAVNQGQTIYYHVTSSTSPRTVEVTSSGNSNNKYSGSVVIPSSVTYDGDTYSVTSIGYQAFWGCHGLTSITIPNSVTSIGIHAFGSCYGLTSITIPNSVTSIGSSAFKYCSSLTSITIPNSVTSIGNEAFSGCSGLTSITIPNSVTSIGDRAFTRCDSLANVTIPNSVTSIGDWAFAGNNISSIIVSSGNTVYDSRNNCNAIIETSSNTLISGCKNTIIPNTVTTIGNNAFRGCSGQTSITIPNSVTSIGDRAFAACIGLTSITIPNSVTSIGDAAFAYCSGLTSITIPNSVTSIGNQAFESCTGLASITIPNSVTSIGDRAFASCIGLTSITIPNSVTSIGNQAFESCTGLTSITSQAATAPLLGIDVFQYVSDTIPVYVPCGSLSSYYSRWSYFSNFIEEGTYSFSAVSSDDIMGGVSILAQPSCSNPTATIMAVANTGYRFTHWSDGETNNPRIVNVTSDTTIIAHFDVVNGIETNESLVQIYEQGGSFYINGAEGEALVIYDVYGRVIYQGTAEDNKPYEMPQPGVYMVKVGNNPAQKVVIK